MSWSARVQADLLTPSFIPRRGAAEERGGGAEFSVVWWDPRALKLGAEAPLGIRRPELIVKDVAPDIVESGLAAYNSWRERRQQALDAGSQSVVSRANGNAGGEDSRRRIAPT